MKEKVKGKKIFLTLVNRFPNEKKNPQEIYILGWGNFDKKIKKKKKKRNFVHQH